MDRAAKPELTPIEITAAKSGFTLRRNRRRSEYDLLRESAALRSGSVILATDLIALPTKDIATQDRSCRQLCRTPAE